MVEFHWGVKLLLLFIQLKTRLTKTYGVCISMNGGVAMVGTATKVATPSSSYIFQLNETHYNYVNLLPILIPAGQKG